MPSYLLTWNPRKYPLVTLRAELQELQESGRAKGRWSCRNGQARIGDRVFLLRQGEEPRGIVGMGTIVTAPFQEKHWDSSTRKVAQYVMVEWEMLDEEDPFISRRMLDEPPFDRVHWNAQMSGIHVPDDVSRELVEIIKTARTW